MPTDSLNIHTTCVFDTPMAKYRGAGIKDLRMCAYSLQFRPISSAKVCRLLDSECLLFTWSLTDRSANGWQRAAYPSLRATPCPPPSIHQSLQLAQTPSRSALQFHKLPVTISGTTTLGRGRVSPQSVKFYG